MNKIVTVLGVMLILLGITMSVNTVAKGDAFTGVQEIVQLPNPGILPDSPVYGIKKFFENMGTLLTFGDNAKTQRYINLSEERLAEIIAMKEKGKPVGSLVEDYNNKLTEINRLQNTTSVNVLVQVTDSTSEYLFILERIRQNISEQDNSTIGIAINLSQMANQGAIEHIGRENPENISGVVNSTQMLVNRLIIQKNFSATFKDVFVSNIDRQVAFLESLKENTTIQSQQDSIQGAINSLEKLKEEILSIEMSQTSLPISNITIPEYNMTNMTGNVLAIGTSWNADQPTTVTIEITAKGAPVNGVSIKIDNNSVGTSDTDGKLSYTFTIFGTHLVQVSKEGYKDAVITMILTPTGISTYSTGSGGVSISAHSQAGTNMSQWDNIKDTWVQDVKVSDMASIVEKLEAQNAAYIQNTGSQYIIGLSKSGRTDEVGIYFRDPTRS